MSSGLAQPIVSERLSRFSVPPTSAAISCRVAVIPRNTIERDLAFVVGSRNAAISPPMLDRIAVVTEEGRHPCAASPDPRRGLRFWLRSEKVFRGGE